MITTLFWFRWSPPELDAGEQRSLAKAVRSHGVGTFVRRFLALSSRDLPDGGFHATTFFETQGAGLVYFALTVCGFLFLDINGPLPDKDSNASVLVALVPIAWVGAILFYGSMFVATYRYAAWLSGVTRQYRPEPVDFHVQPDSPASVETSPRSQPNDAVVDAHISRIVECSGCGQKLRLPVSAGRLSVRCPKCRTEWETDT